MAKYSLHYLFNTFDDGKFISLFSDFSVIFVKLYYYSINIYCYCLSVVKYRVTIITGNITGSGTDASVYMSLVGDQGDTGERFMFLSKTNVNKFEKGNVSYSYI